MDNKTYQCIYKAPDGEILSFWQTGKSVLEVAMSAHDYHDRAKLELIAIVHDDAKENIK